MFSRKYTLPLLAALLFATPAFGVVVINEVYVNAPNPYGSREFIELIGPPNMKLDGYAIALVNGSYQKYWPLGTIPPFPIDGQEIDEFFGLDGMRLGKNGILVITRLVPSATNYPTMLSDANSQNWNSLWSGPLDVPGGLNNDNSSTLMLIRNRPGIKQTDPTNPDGLRWGKDVDPDAEVESPAIDPDTGLPMDKFGNGSLDNGNSNGYGGYTLDLKGASNTNLADDLEVVDEFSWEDAKGWEYDVDNRHVDVGATLGGLKERRVHNFGDPKGFNPDAFTRVDYRTKGPGWTPVAGATGQTANSNNWQDTVTEQWIRGETAVGTGGQGTGVQFFYLNDANTDTSAVQPYITHVPLWLNDGTGAEYNFASTNTYQLMPGRINPLATPFNPGDVDRDGACNAADIAKMANVFGRPNWVFSNSFPTAPEGDSADPATQTRPWDVDLTGDNGIEPSDLQWVLNFQGNTNGQVVGVRYDSTTPSSIGIVLNANTGTTVTVSTATALPCGGTLSTMLIGDTLQLTVRAQVTAGANNTANQQNGIMQFVHDLTLATAGVLRVTTITPLGGFNATNASIQALQGTSGDAGVKSINGYTTSFTSGLSGATDLYRITLQAVGAGSTTLTVAAASQTNLLASTPRGFKIGHTATNGDPAAASYAAALNVTVANSARGDFNNNGHVDSGDVSGFVNVLLGNDTNASHVNLADMNCDTSADGLDIPTFVNLLIP